MSAPPSPPARIGAQAVHQPPWLARVSAATPYLAGSATSGDVEASGRRIRHRRGPDPWRERRRSRTGTDGGRVNQI